MKISVIVPVLNEEQFVGRLLESLQKQTFRDFDVLVVDGGSRDRTVETVKEYGVRVIGTQKGVAMQRNEGARFSDGEIFYFTEADTILPPDHLAKLTKLFEEGIVAVAGPGLPYDADGAIMIEYKIYNAFRYVVHRLFGLFQSSGYNMAVRQHVFKDSGGFPNVIPNDDGLFGRKVAKNGKTIFSLDIPVLISSRRAKTLGFWGFQSHYIFMLENVMPFLTPLIDYTRKTRKSRFEMR